MRTPEQIHNLILNIANADDRIIAALLNGSRANPNIKPDPLQDFDIQFIVKDFGSFIKDHNWTNVFGDKLLWQLPDEMSFSAEKRDAFSYLMLFEDGIRIDLTIFPFEKMNEFKKDGLTKVWLDKEGLFPSALEPSDRDYHISAPTEKEFLDTCNEFWWVSTYVAKGLARNEITYAKEMMETVVRVMFMKVLAWKIGSENNFAVSLGKGAKHAKQYLIKEDYDEVMKTYADSKVKNNWTALFAMTDLFERFVKQTAERLKFRYDVEEGEKTVKFIKKIYKDPAAG